MPSAKSLTREKQRARDAMAAAGLELTEGLEGLVTADLSMSVELEPSPKSSSGAGRGEPEDWATSPVLLASRGSPKDGATEVVPFAGYEEESDAQDEEEEEPEEHAEHEDHEGYVVLELTVPEGKGGGDTMEAMMEEGHMIELEIPEGRGPGDAR